MMNRSCASIRFWIIALAFVFAGAGCKSSDNPPPGTGTPTALSNGAPSGNPSPASGAPAAASQVDPCKLLTSDELKAVQGESLKDASRSDRENPEFVVSQCYYLLPTAANSVVVSVTTPKNQGKGLKEFWHRTFEDKSDARGDEGDTEEESARPEKISGIGADAYWERSGVGGALYVLTTKAIFRISVGGAGDPKAKLNKSKTLAQKALARL